MVTAGNRVEPVSTWCPPGRPVRVADLDIPGGAMWWGPGAEPSAVDPSLPVDLRTPDWDGRTVTALRYDRLSPPARGAYLMWLATGRRAAQAPPAWASLYLLGLERRLVHDGDDDPALADEARALGALYGPADPALARLAAGLGEPPHDPAPPALDPLPSEFPTELAVELGRRALAGTPVTAPWALAWAWFHPRIALQESARRAPAEFARLWRLRFDERYPLGLRVPTRRRRLTLDYEPANPTLPRPIERTVRDASDVVDHAVPERVLRDVTDSVEQELAPFARWASRNPEGGSVEATAALLPAVLLAGSAAGSAVEPLVEWAADRLAGGGPVLVAGRDLVANWTGDRDRAGSLTMIQVLERNGVGIEPDVRFGGRPIPDDDSPVVMFASGARPASTPSAAYVLAAVTTELCMAVAAADGSVDDAETALLVGRIDRIDELSTAERLRLAAHRLLVGERRVDLDEVAARAGTLPGDSRRELARTVVDLALLDGTIGDDERRVVQAVHGLLGVQPDDARLAPDPVAAPDDRVTEAAPVIPGPGAGVEPGAAVESSTASHPEPDADLDAEPSADVASARVVSLDEARLARTQASNADVRALLGAIFAEDGGDDGDVEDAAVAAPPTVTDEQRIGSLDVRHSTLLRELGDAGTWSRPELERVCARLAVLPDGALDVLNEASYDGVGEPVIELLDDGSVVVDTEILEEMRA